MLLDCFKNKSNILSKFCFALIAFFLFSVNTDAIATSSGIKVPGWCKKIWKPPIFGEYNRYVAEDGTLRTEFK